MARLLFITDYTEQFAYRLLRGIISYSSLSGKWVVYRMTLAEKRKLGIDGVVKWALGWKADVVVGQFEEGEDVGRFRENGIVAIAQDYITKFKEIPNITADYVGTGRMAAEYFITRGFRNFAFFGYKDVCWSSERYDGFAQKLQEAGYGSNVEFYDNEDMETVWYYNSEKLAAWLHSLPKPIAIMTCDDTRGNILLNACNSCGIRVPDDIAVMGVDNDEVLDNLSDATLSSIEVDIEKGGYAVAEMAEKMMKDPAYKGEDIVLQPVTVVTRMSTSIFATSDKVVAKVLNFINNNIDKKISVPDILREIPMSRRLLENRFKDVTGDTIYNYILRQRVDRFAFLLLHTSLNVSEITIQMDEIDPKGLCRRFKALKGCTPSEYKEKNLRKLAE